MTVDSVRVEVADEGRGTPVLVEPDADAEAGRGLKRVDGLASSWGVQPRVADGRTVVWFELSGRTGNQVKMAMTQTAARDAPGRRPGRRLPRSRFDYRGSGA